MIKLALDFTSASSYLAIGPTIALGKKLGVELEFLPFHSPVPNLTPSTAMETIGERHARIKQDYRAQDTRRYAQVQGLALTADPRYVDSRFALECLLYANDANRGHDYVSSVFEKFWAGKLDLEDQQSLVALLNLLDIPSTTTVSLTETRLELEGAGVFNVPTYLVEGQLFQGREHLPMIEWLLSDQKSRLPL